MGGFTGLNSADAANPMKIVWAPAGQASSLSFKAVPTAQRTSCSRSPVKASPKTPREPQAQVPSASRLPRDFENKLIAADTDNDSMDGIFNKFDALDRRVGRDDGTANVAYFQAGQQTIADYPSSTATSSPTYTYVFASYIDEPVMRGGSGGLRYYHRNQQYSITAVSDGGGAIVERYAYSAYGQVTIADGAGSQISNSGISNRFMFTGREWDEGLSLYHYRARMYDAVAGRFLSSEPIGFGGSEWNLYEMLKGRVCGNVDPYGLWAWPVTNPQSGRPRGPSPNIRDNKGCCNVTKVRLICRTMPDAFHSPFLSHCYLSFEGRDGRPFEVISGQGHDESHYSELVLSDVFWDLNYALGKSYAVQTEHPIAITGGNMCDAYDCIYAAAVAHHGTTYYNQLLNNSNSLLSVAMNSCGTLGLFPPSAVASEGPANRLQCIDRCVEQAGRPRDPIAARGIYQACSAICEGFRIPTSLYQPPPPPPPYWPKDALVPNPY
jgi:RHS repeat-associated protein